MDESRSTGALEGAARIATVVVVPGLWMRGASMHALGARLAALGYTVQQFNYPSVRGALDDNAAALERFVASVPGDVVHLVGHSLGGVLIRALLERGVPPRIGRVVCLGSPLRGSRTARRVARLPGGFFIAGRTLLEHDARGGFASWCTGVEAGGIAGGLSFGAGLLVGPFGEPNDGTVAVAETQVAGLADHIVLRVSHVALLWSRQVGDQVEHFLEHGRFEHAPRP